MPETSNSLDVGGSIDEKVKVQLLAELLEEEVES